jgi:hypothetical protein
VSTKDWWNMSAPKLGGWAIKKRVRVKCDGPGCANKRIHFEQPDTPRGIQYVSVPTNYHGPVFCSMECHMYWKAKCNPTVKETE